MKFKSLIQTKCNIRITLGIAVHARNFISQLRKVLVIKSCYLFGFLYDMAVNGARQEERLAAQAQLDRAKGAVQEVNAYVGETVQIAQMDGEVSSIYPKIGELVGTGSPIMTISMMNDLWGTFNVREDQLNGMQVGTEFSAYVPAFDKEVRMKVYHMKDQGSYAVWKATKANGQYDLKTFEVKARPTETLEGLRPGMSLIIR